MKKNTFIVFILLCISTVLLSCSPVSFDDPIVMPYKSKNVGVRAIYLVQEIGQLSENDLGDHPEVLVVHTFLEFQDIAATHSADLWIDEDAVDLVDPDWLHQEPQKYYPLVLVGCSEPLYAFRELLTGFNIEGPDINWETKSLKPGFSVWILQEEDEYSTSAFMKGYKEEATVQSILDTTDVILRSRY
jgi:hypothetical protein